MIEFLLELLLEFLGFSGLKKKRKKRNTQEEVPREGVLVCAGCNRILEKDVIYELGKSWCTDCYKTHVLKIKP